MCLPNTSAITMDQVHMASIGAPIVGDLTYGRKSSGCNKCDMQICEWSDFRQAVFSRLRQLSTVPWCGRLFLHCYRIKCKDLNGNDFRAEAPLPAELEDVLSRLCKVG